MESLVIKIMLIIAIILTTLIIYFITKGFIREKRFSDFTLSKDDFNDISLFDHLNIKFWKLVHSLSHSLEKNKLLNALASDYNRYITINEENYKKPIDYITLKLITTIVFTILIIIFMISTILPNNIMILMLFIIIGYVLPDIFWQLNYYKKCQSISAKLYQSIIIINDALKNHQLDYAIDKVINELDGPIQDEYKKVLIDMSYNINVIDAFKRFYKRTKIKSIKIIYNALMINKTNLYDTFSLIREEYDYINNKNNITTNINNIIDVLSYVYGLIPIIFIIMLLILNVDYFKIIKTSPIGFIFPLLVIILYVILLLFIRKIDEVRK